MQREVRMTGLDADTGPPPRHVEAWTRVVGHVPISDPARPFCPCGWSAAGQDPREAVRQHLRDAWPVLVPRHDGETHEQWRERVAIRHAEALDARESAWEAHRMGRPLQPGQTIPTIPHDYAHADENVQVLEHQLDDLDARMRGERGC